MYDKKSLLKRISAMNKESKEARNKSIKELAEMKNIPESVFDDISDIGVGLILFNDNVNSSRIRKELRKVFGKEKLNYYDIYGSDGLVLRYDFENGIRTYFYVSSGREDLLKKISGGKCQIVTETIKESESTYETIVCDK